MSDFKGEIKRVRLCSLWEKQINKKDGTTFSVISGTIGECFVNLERNRFKKEGSNQPDYNLFLTPKFKKPEGTPTEEQKNVDDIAF
jgi:hypothetical protein